MPRFLKSMILATVIVVVMPKAHAGLLLEPYLGYHTGTFTCCTLAASATQNGVSYGARVGYESLGFMIGGDFMSGSWSLGKLGGLAAGTATPTDLGIFVGYNFPVMIRVYGVYGFNVQDSVLSQGTTTVEKGTNIKLGVGFTVYPMVSINVEYIADTYPKNNTGTNTPSMSDAMYGVTLSVPFNLF